jgi:hypothetical protein
MIDRDFNAKDMPSLAVSQKLSEGGFFEVDDAFAFDIFFGFILGDVLDAMDDGLQPAGRLQHLLHHIVALFFREVAAQVFDTGQQDLKRLA